MVEADDQAIQTILLGLPEDIYAVVDSCETAQEICLHVQQMMKDSDIRIQEKKAKLFNEWERFTSTDEESIESYYHLFSKLTNDFKRNKHFPEKSASNLKFLNNLQPEWSRHVTIVHQTKDFHTEDYTQLYDFLKYNQKEVDDLRDERLAKTHDPLALMENFDNPFNYPMFHPDQPSSNVAVDLDEIEKVNANYILMANLQRALTSGTRADKAPIYDSDGSVEYTELLEPILEPHQVQQNDSNVISEVSSVEQDGRIVDQHPAIVEETHAYFESLYNNLAIEVKKVNTVKDNKEKDKIRTKPNKIKSKQEAWKSPDLSPTKSKPSQSQESIKHRWPPKVTLGRLLPHARGLGFKPRRGGFPSGAKNEWGLSHKAKQYTVNHLVFNVQNELFNSKNKLMEQLTSMCDMVGQVIHKKEEENQIEEEQTANARYWKIHACYNDDDDDYAFAITPNEPINSLSMRDEHLDTIPATESDEFIKSSVENLVPNPSESEGEFECDVPAHLPKKIYLNPLFDEEIIPMKIDQHHYNAESDLIESLLNHDSSIISSSKIDSLFDEFADELTLLKLIPPEIDETDCYPEEESHFIKRLLYDNSSPRPPEEFVFENSNTEIESFSPSPIPVEDNDSLMEEIDLSFTLDYPMPPGIEDDDHDSERDILICEELLSNNSLSLPEKESFHFDIHSFFRPSVKPPDGNT
nr:hypothetical protein [Tanacetum cinerariifolium]